MSTDTKHYLHEIMNAGGIRFGSLPWWLASHKEGGLDPDVYLSRPYLVFDLETTNLDKGAAVNPQNDVVAASWWRPEWKDIRYWRGGLLDQATLVADVEAVLREGGFLVAHNAKFDLQWLARMGVDLHKVLVYDTMIGEYVLAGNRRVKLGLGDLAKRYGMPEGKAPYVDTLMKGGVCPSEMPKDYLRARAIRDVKQTIKIFQKQRRRLKKEGKLAVQFTRCIFTPVLADIELQGVAVHAGRTYEEHSKATMELGIAEAEFEALFGEVNARSVPQMAKLIYGELGFPEPKDRKGNPVRNKPTKQFPDGAPKVDVKTLDKLVPVNHRQREFLRLRKEIGKKAAALSKALDFFKGIVEEYDGIFYGQFNQTVTQTHRLSSSGRRRRFEGLGKELGVQLQNMPGLYKDLLCPKTPGTKLADADGSQLEFRVAAFLGEDSQAVEDIRNDVDRHVQTAKDLYGYTESTWAALSKDEKKSLRQGAKAETFKPLYGGSRGTEEQMRYYAAFRERFSGLSATQEDWTYEVLARDKLKLPWGLEFFWPGTKRHDRTGYIDNTPSIYNYPIQCLATAEIIPIAITYLWHRIEHNDQRIKLVNTVHDSVVAEIPDGTEKLWKALASQAFTADVYQYLDRVYGLDFDVPLGVGVSIGERWNSPDAEEWEINVERDGEYWMKGSRQREG